MLNIDGINKLEVGEKAYNATFLGAEHLKGNSKENKPYDFIKVRFDLHLIRGTGDTYDLAYDTLVEPTEENIKIFINKEKYKNVRVVFCMGNDPTYKNRFVGVV